jgi:hypothetical protein
MVMVVAALAGPAWAQEASSQRFADYTAAELASEFARLKAAGALDSPTEAALAQRATTILSDPSQREGIEPASLGKLAKIAGFGLDDLPAESLQQLQVATAQLSVPAGSDDPSLHASYDWIHFRVEALRAAEEKTEAENVLKQWIEATGINRLSVEMTRWCLEQALPNRASCKEFSAVWSGNLSVPRSGQYVFSVSPIISSKSLSGEITRHQLRVFVNDQLVVEASPGHWAWKGSPVLLAPEAAATLRVEVSYSATDPTFGDSPHAILSWEGPGISRSIVPASALTLPDGQGAGLQGEYTIVDESGPHTLSQVTPTLEFAWATCGDVAPSSPELVAALTSRLYELATAPEYIAQQAAPLGQRPAHAHPYLRNYTSTEYLGIQHRGEFLELLLQNPAILEGADSTQLLRLYSVLRFANEERAIDLVGTWAQQRIDSTAVLSGDFFKSNRTPYRTLALFLTRRTASDVQPLLHAYLENPDGSCCLPVAYALAYCHLFDGTVGEWIDDLNVRLAEKSLTGDRRVPWLLARAQAEEIARDLDGPYVWPKGQLLAGLAWLDEASLAAESDPYLWMAVSERLAQRAALGQFSDCQTETGKLKDILPADYRDDLARWESGISDLQSQFVAARQSAAEQQREAYLSELQRRRDHAVSASNDAEAARIDELISTSDSSAE